MPFRTQNLTVNIKLEKPPIGGFFCTKKSYHLIMAVRFRTLMFLARKLQRFKLFLKLAQVLALHFD